MAQEIELKFIVNHSAVEALRDHLNTLGGEHHDPVQLLNIYYETPDNWLRGHDMGLRIRGENGRYEMTMKVAGRVTGGLHQRPEYNVALSEPTLDLAQLPTEVWPNAQWQYHEELWVRGNDAAKEQVLAAIGLVRHTLMLFGGIVPRKASTHLRDLLTQCEATIASAVSAVTAVYSTETAMAKLALTEWLVSKAWQPFLDAKAQSKISDSFKRFADIHLSRHAAELKSVFCQPLGDRYRDQLPRLTRDIDSILLLAGYYDPVVAQDWLENWQGLRHAIATGQRIEIEHFRNEANNQEPFWLHSGKR